MVTALECLADMDRTEQLMVVVAVWILVILFSNAWLVTHRYGPLEWLWRRWTYGYKIPNRKGLGMVDDL